MTTALVPYAPPPAVVAAYKARQYCSLQLDGHAEHLARLARMTPPQAPARRPAPPPTPAPHLPPPPLPDPFNKLPTASNPLPPLELPSMDAAFRLLSLHQIVQAVVAASYGLPVWRLLSDERTARVVLPRHIAMWLWKDLSPSTSLPEIGRRFARNCTGARRDHTTVLSAIRKIDRLNYQDDALHDNICRMREQVRDLIEQQSILLLNKPVNGTEISPVRPARSNGGDRTDSLTRMGARQSKPEGGKRCSTEEAFP